MSELANSLADKIKESLPKKVGSIASIICLVGTFLIQFGSSKTHYADVQQQHEKRISDVENYMKNDLATKEAVKQMNDSNNRRFDDLKEQIKQYHDDEVRFHHR